MRSPVVHAVGVGQVGEGVSSTWGLDDDEDDDEEGQMEERTNTDRQRKGRVNALYK